MKQIVNCRLYNTEDAIQVFDLTPNYMCVKNEQGVIGPESSRSLWRTKHRQLAFYVVETYFCKSKTVRDRWIEEIDFSDAAQVASQIIGFEKTLELFPEIEKV